METTTVLTLAFSKEEQGILLFKDSNELLYFSIEESKPIIEGPYGSPQGFKEIKVFEKIVQCTTVKDIFCVYLRGEGKWLKCKNSFDFYEGKIFSLTEDFIQLSVEGSSHDHYATYLFNEDRFVPNHILEANGVGFFKKCEKTEIFNGEKVLFLSPDHGYRAPDKMVYFIAENSFLTIPLPVKLQKEGSAKETNVFFFVAPKYVVLRYGSDFNRHFFVYNLETKSYLSLSEKGEIIMSVKCTDKYLACSVKHNSSEDAYWKILNTDNWEEVKGKFKVDFSSSVFSEVEVEDGKMVVSFNFSQTLNDTLK